MSKIGYRENLRSITSKNNIKTLEIIRLKLTKTAANIGLCAMAIRIYSQRQNKTQRHIGLARPLRNLI